MIEAEYKAKLSTPDAVREHLRQRGQLEIVTYHDTYFDDHDRSLTQADRELRLRTITNGESTQHLLTFKDAAVDAATGSKPEYETAVAARDVLEQIITRLGYSPVISFSKHCENYRFSAQNRHILATVATVAELDGTFLELETQVPDETGLSAALRDLRNLLHEFGVSPDELTTERYTEAVERHRGHNSAGTDTGRP